MNRANSDFDAIVIGAGVGGMYAAALLTAEGMRVLVLEKSAHLGGRFSTVVRGSGYSCAIGGLAVQVGGPMERLCEELGIPSGVKPASSAAILIRGEYFEISRDGGSLRRIIKAVSRDEDEARRVLNAYNHAFSWLAPSDAISFSDWLNQYTTNEKIHGIFQATIASLLTVNSWELPAKEYFELIKVIAPLRFGFVEGGSIRLWERMAAMIASGGGTVLSSAPTTEIRVDQGRVTGVSYKHEGGTHFAGAPIVVSNTGPGRTVELAGRDKMEASYLRLLDETLSPTAILWLHFSSNELLLNYSAVAVACARRINMIDVPSLECPDVAPPGKHLYTVGAAPLNSQDPGDIRKEMELVIEDLREIIPDFDARCDILTKTCYRDKWPGFRTRPGAPLPIQTPVENLYNVGDSVCPRGYAGSMGAAHSAQLVRDQIRARRNLKTT